MGEQETVTVIDKRCGWRVLHPSRFSGAAIAGSVLFGGGAVLGTGYGTDLLVAKGNFGGFLFLLGASVAGLGFLYFETFAYYVAVDERYVAQGRRRRAPSGVVERSAVSYATRGSIHQ